LTWEDWVKLILQSNVVAAVVVGQFGLLSLWLGLGKFRSEKWWEKKATAYAASIEGLHGMYDLSKARLEALESEHDISNVRLTSLQTANLAGLAEIRKGASIGSFVMSKYAVSILSTVLSEFDAVETQSIHEFFDERVGILSDAIIKLTVEAKRDLRTK